jgi:hypothetical protein
MKRTISLYRAGLGIALIACALLCLDCSDLLLDEMERLADETNRPEILPAAGTIIPSHEVFTLKFPKSMSEATISVSGSIGGATTQTETATYADDRLVVSPASFWTKGSSQTLRITVVEGGETASYDYTYTVFDGVCVSTTGSDTSTGKGTVRAPYATIQNGITQAKALHPSSASEVHVAAGTYTITETATTSNGYALGIEIQDLVSVMGGYALDWKSRDWNGNATSIVDARTTVLEACLGASNGVSSATVIEGVSITASSADTDTIGIVLFSSEPVIRNNIITLGGNSVTAGMNRSGIALKTDGSSTTEFSPLIEGNTINGGGGSQIGQCYGINVQSCTASPIIRSNAITAGTAGSSGQVAAIMLELKNTLRTAIIERNVLNAGSGGSTDETTNACMYAWPSENAGAGFVQLSLRNNLLVSPNMSMQSHSAMYLDTTSATTSRIEARNNTILLGGDGGSGRKSTAVAMKLGTGSELHVDNNIFYYHYGTSDAYAFHLVTGSGSPNASSTAHANDLGKGSAAAGTFYVSMNASGVTATGLSSGGVEIFTTSSGNLQTDPLLDTITGQPTASTPSSVYSGGLDGASLSWGFTNDLDGLIRTGNGSTGWSMGCYESNP